MEEKEIISRQEEDTPEGAFGPGPGQRRNGRRRPPRRLLPLILLVAVLAAAGGGIYWWTNRPAMDATTKYWFDKAAKSGSLAGKSPEDIRGMLDTIVEEGMFNVSVNARVIFEDGGQTGSLGLENVSANRYYCRAALKRDSDGKVLYKSDGLKPGQYIDQIQLNEALPAGNYPCTVQIIATDPETLEDIGQVDVQVEVVVLN